MVSGKTYVKSDSTPNDEDKMFEFIHKTYYSKKKGKSYISRSFFKKHLEESFNVSADWSQKTIPPNDPKYTQSTRTNPDEYGVISQIVSDIRNVEAFTKIKYEPTHKSKAHCNIKFNEERLSEDYKLIRKIASNFQLISSWEIEYPSHP